MLTTIREEQFLAKFAGEDVPVPQPCTRTEKFLAKMAGVDVQTPTPITREEQILNKIAEGGGGGGGDSDFSTAEVTLVGKTENVIDYGLKSAVAYISGDELICSDYFIMGTYTLVLYKGEVKIYAMIAPDETSGDATVEVEGKDIIITITGDCTLTIPELV